MGPFAISLTLALVMTGVGVGCTSPGRPVHSLERVEVAGDTVEENGLLALGSEEVREALMQRLSGPHFIRPSTDSAAPSGAPRDAPRWRATLEVAFAREVSRSDREGRWAEVGATLSLRRADGDEAQRYELFVVGEARVEGEGPDARRHAARAALNAALSQLADNARLQLDAVAKKDSALIEDLQASDERVRHFAVQALAMRRHPAAAPRLIDQLKSDDDFLVRSAMGALVELREPTAIPVLIDRVRGSEPQFERELIFAIAAIGGDEARAYLYTVGQGHDDPRLRAAAREGFEELEARRSPPRGDREATR